MSIASTNKEIILIKHQIKQLSEGIPTFDGSLYSQTGHTHSINDITALTTTLAGKASAIHTHAINDITNLTTTLSNKQDKLTAGTNINFVGNTINALSTSQWSRLGREYCIL